MNEEIMVDSATGPERAGTSSEQDAKLIEFLNMAEGVDVDVAVSLLESTNWDLHEALGHIFDLGRTNSAQAYSNPPRSESTGMFGGGSMGRTDDISHVDSDLAAMDDVSPAARDYHAQAGGDADLLEAIRIAQMADDRELVQRQEREYHESLRMDQLKASQGTSETSVPSESSRDDIAERRAAEQDRKRQIELAEDLERKRSRLPAEPLDTDAHRIAVVIRLPTGKRLQRNFSKDDRISAIYDFVDVNIDTHAKFDLVSVHPKKCFNEQNMTLQEANLDHQTTLLLRLHD